MGYGGMLFDEIIGQTSEDQIVNSKNTSNDRTVGVEGRRLTNVLLQQQRNVLQLTGRGTELSNLGNYTDGLERRVTECTEKQLTAGQVHQTESQQE